MVCRLLFSLMVILGSVACAHQGSNASAPVATSTVSGGISNTAKAHRRHSANPCGSSDMTYKGTIDFEGVLGRTKGAQLTIESDKDGWAILRVSKELKRRDWRGKTVRVTGDRCDYRCPLIGQCVTDGTIPYVINTRIEVISSN